MNPPYTCLVLRAFKLVLNKAAGDANAQAYFPGYVEHIREPRTQLKASFNARLTEEGHYGQTHQQVVDPVGEDTGQKASGLFIDPRPDYPAPTDAQQPHQAIAVGNAEDAGADQRCRKKAEFAAENREQ